MRLEGQFLLLCEFFPGPCSKVRMSGRCKFREAFLSEVKFRLTLFKETDFYRADFFKTPLKGMDMSDCILDGILVSETFRELRGMKGGIEQALSLAGLLGMEIK